MPNEWMIYGAYGHAGSKLVELAVRRGHQPILAGRDAHKLDAIATRLGLKTRQLTLEDPNALATTIEPYRLIVAAAGPFFQTGAPLLDACLARKAHYLDVCGEIHHMRRGLISGWTRQGKRRDVSNRRRFWGDLWRGSCETCAGATSRHGSDATFGICWQRAYYGRGAQVCHGRMQDRFCTWSTALRANHVERILWASKVFETGSNIVELPTALSVRHPLSIQGEVSD